MEVGIVAQQGNDRAASLAESLRERLRRADVTVRIDTTTAETLGLDGFPVGSFGVCDLVVSIGGDGTFLFAAREAEGTPILGVNLGEVGFLNAVGPEAAERAVLREVEAFRADELSVTEVSRIGASVGEWQSEPAMNELVVQGGRRGRGGGATVEARVDGSLYSGGLADGVLVATPTGSSAYNLSESGPLVHPSVDGLILNEMAALEGMPPLVVAADSELTVTITDAESAVIIGDGRTRQEFEPPITVSIGLADEPVRLAGPVPDFFEALGKLD